MLTVISPAKSLDMTPVSVEATDPIWQEDALRLAKTARNLPLKGLKDLMDISDDLARLNRDRFRDFAEAPEPEATRPAAFVFAGDTYQGLEARTLDPDDLAWAQDHLRILSGLYGLLRPLDAIQPYRLEMESRLKTRRGKSLYEYWGDQIAKALNAQADELGADTLVNCASEEYFRAADRKALKLRVVTPVFMELKDDKPRIVSFFAKRARGAMARYVTENRLTDPDDIRGFATGGYAFDPDLSEGDKVVFVRDYPQT
ncbi:peroxide stress protein YaaA [Ponticoccus sp. SC2-23]|uniref:peroxide stress protein YaaA n=1 Tax=Alexandriicola marinus TaxID=2081710 RepID=UPI000FD816E0|nr:peroxide stress protein YaaA [Alexandriicola marinus]MBM1219933.1 peroxide stress protein YaaA [Ponticoccus sp. SC6-9]MBM1224619.1 peroxide stress protein YaaA [Ponticoccus sp. SC6-15]MBM1228132.1 peroxide stress protein YaaA [Ponticoccus sp. SC6-38]MBM1234230.1 peroxide stress protein YaaA [Ponticoccus sp. SC6-45]MBM1238634.1 peroxide stress protein YaaA [Ponticoccus sp. SC6-49]MBM1242415.1 peroxide stress protein YaaA [Ponticoccus sp. SC2-64]MBM1247754.1 peroxide stress protein YaaA [Po